MYIFYRESTIGKALQEVLRRRVNENDLTKEQALKILQKYDAIIPLIFEKFVHNDITFKGKVKSYNHCNGVWKFSTTDFNMSLNNDYVSCVFMKIVAADADTNPKNNRKRRGKKSNDMIL